MGALDGWVVKIKTFALGWSQEATIILQSKGVFCCKRASPRQQKHGTTVLEYKVMQCGT
jgi:hypothetical protein